MTVTIVGSVAFDTLFTPEGNRERIIGGSAVYAALACSKFSKTAIVGVVGTDYDQKHLELLASKNINTSDIESVSGETFHWTGSYLEDINVAKTVDTKIGVLGAFVPKLNNDNQNTPILFLANCDPDSQLKAIQQSNASLKVLDTMNIWIEHKKVQLLNVIGHVNVLFINDAEIKQLMQTSNIIQGARQLLSQFPNLNYLIVKRGEHGSSLFGRAEHDYFFSPAFPLVAVKDPTGAGDSFAGSFLGYINGKKIEWSLLKEALHIASATASCTVEAFGPDQLIAADIKIINERVHQLKYISSVN